MGDNDLMALRFGRGSVAENLDRAVAEGRLRRHDDGRLSPPSHTPAAPSPWIFSGGAHLPCQFLNGFLFACAYDQAAVPHGCRDCFKVTVIPRTLRQLVALRDLAAAVDCPAKCGLEIGSAYSQNVYGGFFYVLGLEQARRMFAELRRAVDAVPALGPGVAMNIKRGCTNFEVQCGPSDRYTFRSEQPELESLLQELWWPGKPRAGNDGAARAATLLLWIRTAFQIGDDTYLDFTRGRRLYPRPVSYVDWQAASAVPHLESQPPSLADPT